MFRAYPSFRPRDGDCALPEGLTEAIRLARAISDDVSATNLVIGCLRQPRTKVLFSGKRGNVRTQCCDDEQSGFQSDPGDGREIVRSNFPEHELPMSVAHLATKSLQVPRLRSTP